ncbi:hypothetical protein WR25_24340 [Diploscapter pachys]|uniref:TGF-beta family profile domain-containing protein n=1 Tax=Diploscapter pachys TaxID=2018661 RepID=A0A2A2KBV8_9BILA|nr:hypothetical protein WR25_24340 [Diploscapter pachys]
MSSIVAGFFLILALVLLGTLAKHSHNHHNSADLTHSPPCPPDENATSPCCHLEEHWLDLHEFGHTNVILPRIIRVKKCVGRCTSGV